MDNLMPELFQLKLQIQRYLLLLFFLQQHKICVNKGVTWGSSWYSYPENKGSSSLKKFLELASSLQKWGTRQEEMLVHI